ncbi:MAG: dipeptidase [Peptococcaceae bacterium]|nr:dipeptidase [Peptococcaceae bacterium]
MENTALYSDIHFSSPVVDAHCDTLTVLRKQNRRLGQKSGAGHVDLPRLLSGGVNLQFFAAFVGPDYRDDPLARALEIFDLFFEEMNACADLAEPVFAYPDIERAISRGKVAALLTVEGGEALAGRLEVLRMFYRLGVRGLTLTWNGRNELADGVSESGTGGGLTGFGAAVVREMNRLGMVVDVSHISPRGFWDVIRESAGPVIASHSNCRALCDHPRNLEDDQIRALADTGGVVGLCFYPDFVHREAPSLDSWLDHVEYVAGLAGVRCIGIGSDFDGIESVIPEMADATRLPLVTEGLLKRGFSPEEVRMILGGNFLRVLSQVLRDDKKASTI